MDQQQCASGSRETRAVREPFSARLPHGTLTVSGHATMHRSGSSGPGCASFGSCKSSRPSARHVEEEMLLVCWSAGAANGGDGIGGLRAADARSPARRPPARACSAAPCELRAGGGEHCIALQAGLRSPYLLNPQDHHLSGRDGDWRPGRGGGGLENHPFTPCCAPTRRHKNTAGGWRTGGCWRICPLRAHGDKILPQRSAGLPPAPPLRGHGISRALPHLASPGRHHHHSPSSILTFRQTSDPPDLVLFLADLALAFSHQLPGLAGCPCLTQWRRVGPDRQDVTWISLVRASDRYTYGMRLVGDPELNCIFGALHAISRVRYPQPWFMRA
jgi:hypothetical protein